MLSHLQFHQIPTSDKVPQLWTLCKLSSLWACHRLALLPWWPESCLKPCVRTGDRHKPCQHCCVQEQQSLKALDVEAKSSAEISPSHHQWQTDPLHHQQPLQQPQAWNENEFCYSEIQSMFFTLVLGGEDGCKHLTPAGNEQLQTVQRESPPASTMSSSCIQVTAVMTHLTSPLNSVHPWGVTVSPALATTLVFCIAQSQDMRAKEPSKKTGVKLQRRTKIDFFSNCN